MALSGHGFAGSRDKLKQLILYYHMATKLWRTVTNLLGVLPMLLDPLVTCSVRSRDKLQSLYLYYHSAYGHQTLQDGEQPLRAAIHVTRLFIHVVLRDHVTK